MDDSIHSVCFWSIRHIPALADAPTTGYSRVKMRLIPMPDQHSHLLDLGGRQQYLELTILPVCSILKLSGLDVLLECNLIGGTILAYDDLQPGGRSVEFSDDISSVSNISIMDINQEDPCERYSEKARNRTYVVECKFRLPKVNHPKSNPTAMASRNQSPTDVVFIFPREESRNNFLWSSRRDLAAKSLYFSYLFASRLGCSYNRHTTMGDESCMRRELFQKVSNYRKRREAPLPPVMIDSDDDVESQPLRGRKPRYIGSSRCLTQPNVKTIYWVIVKHTAYRTFRAMLLRLDQRFAFSYSMIASNPRRHTTSTEESYLSSSPKSLYRLGHQLMLSKICEEVLVEYKKQIIPTNFAEELFSEGNYLYPEMRDAVIEAFSSSFAHSDKRSASTYNDVSHVEEYVM